MLLTLYCDPGVLRFGALPPVITCQGLGGSFKLIRLVSRSHVVDVNLEFLCQANEGHSCWPYRGRSFFPLLGLWYLCQYPPTTFGFSGGAPLPLYQGSVLEDILIGSNYFKI